MGGLWLNKTKLIHISTQVEAVFEVWLEIVLKIDNSRGGEAIFCQAQPRPAKPNPQLGAEIALLSV